MSTSSITHTFKLYSDYIKTFSILEKGTELRVAFTFYSYDLVDKDLDFDEKYYTTFMENLKFILVQDTRTALAKGPFKHATVTIGIALMSTFDQLESEIEITETSMVTKAYL